MRFCSLIPAVLLIVPYAHGQEFTSHQNFGVDSSFAPNSSHILIGSAEKRRIWTAGLNYGHLVWKDNSVRLDYEASATPFFQERDPEIIGATSAGSVTPLPISPFRVVTVNAAPIGFTNGPDGQQIPLYPVYGSTKTYAFAFSPIGARVYGRPFHGLTPSFSLNLGAVASSRDLPVDESSKFNYLFSFGPGIGFYYSNRNGIRLEYVYRHMSNANYGSSNPGLDQGVFRLTLVHLLP